MPSTMNKSFLLLPLAVATIEVGNKRMTLLYDVAEALKYSLRSAI
jgi:hypothetical protein